MKRERPPRPHARWAPLAAVALSLIVCGCETFDFQPPIQQKQAEQPTPLEDVYTVAVWYYVRGYVPPEPAQARATMAADFGHIASLGFNTIVADAVDDDRRQMLLDVAESQSLRVILPHARTAAFIKNGQFDPAVMSAPEPVVRDNLQRIGRHLALAMHLVYDVPTPDVLDRLAEVTALYERLDPAHPVFVPLSRDVPGYVKRANLPVVLWDNFPLAEDAQPGELKNRRYDRPATHLEAMTEIYAATPHRRHWMMIQAAAIPGRMRMPTPAEWDVIYLTALSAGFVDGLVFYRYHADKTPDSGLAAANRSMPPGRTAAVRKITKRAIKWGPLLKGLAPTPGIVRTSQGRLRPTLFVGPKRSFLLVYNPDVETFGYDTVLVPTAIPGRAVARAVNVDETERYLPTGPGDEIPIKLRLRPGEGNLFELFAP
ncbi:MAG: hypothetical protein JXQ73_09910 [Phycisphaerae bacterium]|nr:hypothetical protein [Phycisphaerae bacterium]